MRSAIGILMVLGLAVAAGCTSYSGLAELAQGPQMPETYRIGPRDTVLIEYRMNPELNRQLTVGPHGKVEVPLVGEVAVAGKTTTEAGTELTELNKEQLTTPDVTVTVVRYASQVVYVMGEVGRQGPVAYDRPLRLMDAIAMAGGPTLRADQAKVHLTRPSYDQPAVYTCNLRRLMKAGDMMHNPMLQDQDIVYVPPTVFTAIGYKTNDMVFPLTAIFTGIEQTSSATSTVKTYGEQGLGR
ncbi:MAG: polysaccharide biosynthesis/export family protein [Planctomycetota bacterium]